MQIFSPEQTPSLGRLIRVFTILGVLLIALAVIALLGDLLGLLDRFRNELYMFMIGALLAYLMAPVAHLLQRLVRVKWAAVLGTYLLLFAIVLVFGALLVTPFVTQAQSLVKNLREPSGASLAPLQNVQHEIGAIQSELTAQQRVLGQNRPITQGQVQQTQAGIAQLVRDVASIATAHSRPNEAPIPPSYVGAIATPAARLRSAYGQVTPALDPAHLVGAVSAATSAAADVARQATTAYQKAASTPLLLLSLQTVLDQHNISVDLHDRFSEVLQTINSQVSSLLNNALGIGLQAGNLLLEVVLVFIISIYFLSDGGRLVRWLIRLAPRGRRTQVAHAVRELDTILGSYLRTQVVLALLAGLSDAVGAVVLGIPYPVVIFFSSFLLSLVPVIGPVILPVPPLAIALIFAPLPRPIFYLVWLLVGEQIVTNVVGPRLQGHTLGIHPLEAMAAALAGLPLAGLPGAFFAVPAVAFFHIAVRELVRAPSGEDAGDNDANTGEPPPRRGPQQQDRARIPRPNG